MDPAQGDAGDSVQVGATSFPSASQSRRSVNDMRLGEKRSQAEMPYPSRVTSAPATDGSEGTEGHIDAAGKEVDS